jgi:hypothetical protein
MLMAGSAAAQNTSNTETQAQSGASAGVNFAPTTNANQPDSVDTTAGVYPPGLDAGTNPCAVGASGGVGVTGFGASFGFTTTNDDCQDRNWYALTTSRGQNEVAKAYACLHNDKMRAALIATGTDCDKYQRRVDETNTEVVSSSDNDNGAPDYCDDGGWASEETLRNNCPNYGRPKR